MKKLTITGIALAYVISAIVIAENAAGPGAAPGAPQTTETKPAAPDTASPAEPPQRGPGGFGGPGGPMGGSERKLVKQFDKNDDKRLDKAERAEAREWLKKNLAPQRGPGGGRGGPGGFPGGFPGGPGGEAEEAKAGPRVSPADAKPGSGPLYAEDTLRTVFLDFENDDWEQELADFHNTDVEVPATLTVDGEKYPGAGVHFRGASSYFMARAGQKRSLNVSLDFTEKKQRLDGWKSLNLLNSHGDDSMMSTVLYSHIARQFIPAPRANFVRVVINGESWGVFVNAQQFNKDFVQENFRTAKGARWKVKGSPGGGGGLDYIGDKIEDYKRRYDMKDGDDDDWRALITLCKTLKETPPDALEAALKPMLNLDGLLWFLALDCALINTDGYWVRASDYSLYRDKTGKFHVIPHDMNEAFRQPMGPGMGGGRGGRGGGGERPREPRGDGAPPEPGAAPRPPGDAEKAPAPSPEKAEPPVPVPPISDGAPLPPGGFPGGFPGFGGGPRVNGVELDPLTGLDDASKPLRSKILAVPSLRARYLANVRTIAEKWLDWKTLGPLVAQYRALIEKEVAADTRKSASLASFQNTTADEPAKAAEPQQRRGPGAMPLRAFADQRRAYLLKAADTDRK